MLLWKPIRTDGNVWGGKMRSQTASAIILEGMDVFLEREREGTSKKKENKENCESLRGREL